MKKVIHTLLFAVVTSVAVPSAAKVVKVRVGCDSENGGYEAYRAMDGDPTSMWHTDWGAGETPHPHDLVLDLGKTFEITGFVYQPRRGRGNGTIKDYEFYVSSDKKKFGTPVAKGTFTKLDDRNEVTFESSVEGRYLKLRALSEIAGRPWTSVAELEIMSLEGVDFKAVPSPVPPLPSGIDDPRSEAEIQYQVLIGDIRNRKRFAKYAPETFKEHSLILESDRDPLDVILRRTAALLDDLKNMQAPPDLSAKETQLEELRKAADGIAAEEADSRFEHFKKVFELRRAIALSNPLLDFDKLLFAKHHRATFNHMCDQYYGINAVPGGGIYVLHNPFGEEDVREVRDVLADATVENGRLKGQKLDTGSFISPDLSYDGKTILFAYVECEGDRKHRFHTDPSRGHWHQQRCYHVFRVNVDGTDLRQLTDGTWNDFDPCWMPNGRIVFISERRGGYLRCGRVCPTYTLYDMNPDGSDILCISPHETNEWHPSINNDGMIMYTRWDYVDRHGCVAHHPWITTPDGRDARAIHGNFVHRETRPDMELCIRAIPGSSRFTAVAAPHHGQAYGSLIIFDPDVVDEVPGDNVSKAMAPVKRVTPDVAFPESQRGSQVYGSPWPLSEDYYLCVYDSSMKPGMGRQGRKHVRGNYGIYLVDSFGNKIKIYRDPAIACLGPLPLRAREKPPVVPAQSQRHGDRPAEATLGLINVYDSVKPFPEGVTITALRIYQIIPMSVPSGRPPHEVGYRLPGLEGGDSVILARYVLGTVPVEEDGSAYFRVPAMREMFFQALDENGLAVQSMRSSSYLQPGERLVCQGCHEPRHSSPEMNRSVAEALTREPSVPVPDVDGTNPFSYPRLVQPVLDEYCVKCHEKKIKDPQCKKKPPRLDSEVIKKGRGRWYASYHSLARAYGYTSYGDRMRTTPGKFGARASRLYAMLKKGHHGLTLPDEAMHRITVWLDSLSIFYGVYEKEGGEAQLRGAVVRPTLE